MSHTEDRRGPIVNDDVIEVRRTPEFTAIAHRVSGHLNSLPLTSEQHNRLVDLVVEQITEAETAALQQGIHLGIQIGRSLAIDDTGLIQ